MKSEWQSYLPLPHSPTLPFSQSRNPPLSHSPGLPVSHSPTIPPPNCPPSHYPTFPKCCPPTLPLSHSPSHPLAPLLLSHSRTLPLTCTLALFHSRTLTLPNSRLFCLLPHSPTFPTSHTCTLPPTHSRILPLSYSRKPYTLACVCADLCVYPLYYSTIIPFPSTLLVAPLFLSPSTLLQSVLALPSPFWLWHVAPGPGPARRRQLARQWSMVATMHRVCRATAAPAMVPKATTAARSPAVGA